MTKKEIVVRLLSANRGEWINGYELQQKHTKWGFTGVDADTRAHELSRVGYFDSPNFRYYIEHRGPKQSGNPTRYAQFRVTKVEPIEQFIQGVGTI